MAAFLACIEIHYFQAISFPGTHPNKTASSRNNITLLMDLLMKEGNVSDLYSSFSDKRGLIMIVGRSQVSERTFKEPSKGI